MTPSTKMSLSACVRLRLAIFMAGACVMVLQVLGTRIIGPHYGVGLYVWTALITVTLGALALGYWIGGKLADRRPTLPWFASVLLVAAAFVGLIPLARGWVLEAGWVFGLRGGALLSALALFFPAQFFLGMVSPYAIRLEATGAEVSGRSAGRLYAISTAGSVTGALLAGFYLVPHFRIPVLLGIISGSLACAAVLTAGAGRNSSVVIPAVVLGLLAIFGAWPRPKPPGLIHACSFQNSDVRVVDYQDQRFLLVDQTAQSAFSAKGRTRDLYAYFLSARVLLARPGVRHAAIVGLGGGSLLPLLAQGGMDFEVAELSPEIIAAARTYFGLNLPKERVHQADGRVFLRDHPGKFDVIVLDAFSGDRMAYSLVSREGFATAKAALTPGGLLALNSWGIDLRMGRPNRLGASIRRTLEKVFPHVLAVPAAGNLLFFASDAPIEPRCESVTFEAFDGPRQFGWSEVPPTTWPEGVLLTDDWNPADTLDVSGMESLRVRRRADMPTEVRTALTWE